MCVYLYIHKYTQYTHVVCKQTFILNEFNNFTALQSRFSDNY